jgi:hypothetical protein
MSFAEYRGIDAINWHLLEPYRVSARNARNEMLQPSDASDAMRFGEIVHAAVLEPGRLESDYAVMPRFDGHPNSNAHKDAKASWLASNADRVHMTADEMVAIRAMVAATREHPVASRLLDGRGTNELSAVWRIGDSLCKGRIDRLCFVPAQVLYPGTTVKGDVLCLLDLKTTRSVTPFDFQRDVATYAYHGQMAWYHDGVQSLEPHPMSVCIIAVQNRPPYDVLVYRMDDEVLEHGRRLYRRLLAMHLQCLQRRTWPGICPTAISVSLPAWAREPEPIASPIETKEVA